MPLSVNIQLKGNGGKEVSVATQKLEDTRRFHKYSVETNQAGVMGTIYVPIQANGNGKSK